MTQFKDKREQFRGYRERRASWTTPCCRPRTSSSTRARSCPSGEDQVQHVEFTREVARHFNARYGETFPECKALLTATPRVLGLDGDAKMSKSKGNTIGVLETPEQIWDKLRPAKTDPARVKRSDPGTPEKCTIWSYHLLVTPEAGASRDPRRVHERGHRLHRLQEDPPRQPDEGPRPHPRALQRACRPAPRGGGEAPGGERRALPRGREVDHARSQGQNGVEKGMEDLNLGPEELAVDCLGEPTVPSPLELSTVYGDGIANYVEDDSTVLLTTTGPRCCAG